MVDVLRRRAAQAPAGRAFTFLRDGELESGTLSFGELDRGARAVAARLQGLDAGGGRALLLYPAGLDFVVAFFGCLYAGVTPVPVSLPNRQRGLILLRAILQDCRACCLLSSSPLLERLEEDVKRDEVLNALPRFATDTWELTAPGAWTPARISPEQLALLQYTSGSTGTPRGVCVTHANLVHNQRLLAAHFGSTEESTLISWLPMFHDMGLGTALLQAVWLGAHSVLMPPSAFVQKPVRWLQALSRYRGTFSAAPDFAYELCARRIGPELCAELDLSSWRCACNGSEPVRAQTLQHFASVFTPYGFGPDVMRPAYGLAEATLIVTAHALGAAPRLFGVDPEALEHGSAEPARAGEGRLLVSCGRPLPDTELRIVEPVSGALCPAGKVGEIWVSNASVASGYWGRERDDSATFAAVTGQDERRFLRTGDLGFVRDSELFITGRLKDLIILRGRNHYPQDIEASVSACHPALERERCAAFSVDAGGAERLIVVQEVKRTALRRLEAGPLLDAITQAVARDHGAAVHGIALIRPSTLPRTSSGKIQRKACRHGYLEGTLELVTAWEGPLESPSGRAPELDGSPGLMPAAESVVERLQTRGRGDQTPSRDQLRAWLVAWLGRRLQRPARELDARQPLADSGLDSVASVELVRDLSLKLERTLDETTLWSFPTIDALVAEYAEASERDQPHAPVAPLIADEAIAIVGVGCRFPGGVSDLESFWRLLEAGVDAVSEVPPERWDVDRWYHPDPDAPGKMTSRWGGFVHGIERFDPHFFGISPEEALSVDPQQRLLLETSWEALEHAGIPPSELMGSSTGVYMGLCGTEYNARLLANHGALGPYTLLGSMHSTMVGRLSYWLGLRGPNLPVDTACSSSLVAVHLACQALRQREVSLALAGGANVLLDPAASVCFSQLRATSPTGRCRSFSADADGYVRSEGAAVVILERLSDAQKNGHRVLALIRSSAVNQDGRSNGPTAPNGPAQQAVIREALQRANLSPGAVGYVECHGTGTPLGDPIEVHALGAVLARPDTRQLPLLIGSLKSNLGHMEGAAGIGGLIKVALMVERGLVPRSLHFARPNPHIAWHDLALQVASTPVAWPDDASPRVAGVSSFGISGTNAHIIVQQAPPLTPLTGPSLTEPSRDPLSAALCVLSAKTPQALADAALRLHQHLLDNPRHTLHDVAFSLALRAPLEHRLAFVVSSVEELQRALSAAARGQTPLGSARGSSLGPRPRLAWLFTGQGAQRLSMGRGLYEDWPRFRAAFDEACAALDPELPHPLRSVVWADPHDSQASLLSQTAFAQPALFALEWALARLWSSWGVEPDVLLGHSLGEISAACVAGVFTLADAARLVCARARLMQALPAGGTMLAVSATEAEVRAAIDDAEHGEQVSIAAINGPTALVIAGAERAVLQIGAALEQRGRRTQRLDVSHAFHSPLMEPMLAPLREVAASIAYRPPARAMISTVTGEPAGDELATADYWVGQVRAAVRFGAGVRSLARLEGVAGGVGAASVGAEAATAFIEIGPQPTLLGLARAQLPESALLLPSLRPGQPERVTILDALARWFARGGDVRWSALFDSASDSNGAPRRLSLPTYAWQRQRYWLEPSRAASERSIVSLHPLLGYRVQTAAGVIYENVLSGDRPAWLGQHRVGGHVVLPGAALAELLRAAGEHHGLGERCEVRGLVLQAPLIVDTARRMQVVLSKTGTRASVYSQPADATAEADWTLHAEAELGAASARPAPFDLASARRRCVEELDMAATYARFSALGLELGPIFRGVHRLWRGPDEFLAEVTLDPGESVAGYGVHPVLLDFAAQAGFAGLAQSSSGALLPFEFARFSVQRSGATRALVHGRPSGNPSLSGLDVELTWLDAEGNVLGQVSPLRLRQADLRAIGNQAVDARLAPCWRIAWRALPGPASLAAIGERWLVVSAGADDAANELVSGLCTRGAVAERASFAALPSCSAQHVVCLWPEASDAEAAVNAACHGLEVLQGVRSFASPPRLWWLTRHAIAATDAEPVAPAAASVWGLGRTLAHEHPELGCTLLDLDRESSALEILLAELAAAPTLEGERESQVAWRQGRRYVARFGRALAQSVEPARALPAEGSVLVTGGLGALGLLVARFFAERGVRHLVLLGRRVPSDAGTRAAVSELESLGAQVSVAAVDVSDGAALAAVLDGLPPQHPLVGIVHAAGVVDDGVLAELTGERLRAVLAAKVFGADHLHRWTERRGTSLEFFVSFSSLAGTLGAAGQGAYAAANAYLDALAAARRARGLPGTSLAWGPWSERGLAAGLDAQAWTRLSRQGIGAISPEQGMRWFGQLLSRTDAALAVVPLEPAAAAATAGASHAALWRELIPSQPAAAAPSGEWARWLSSVPAARRSGELADKVRGEIARQLSRDPDAIALDAALKDLGFDSLMSLELRNTLGRRLGKILPATLVFDHPTPGAIARFLLDAVFEPTEVRVPAATPTLIADEAIAIVGVGCRFPGGVSDLESFWRLLEAGVDAVSEVPPERWDVDRWYHPDPDAPGKMTSRWGGFVHGIERFDPHFFGISPEEALSVDPQQRLLLETSWEALEHAGIPPSELMGSSTGVYMGLCGTEYNARLLANHGALGPYTLLGSMHSTMVGRLSYWLGLRGPNLPVDTACSSSLVAVHLACQALRQREVSLALAGGANVLLDPAASVCFSQLRATSPTGRCRSFSADADGYVRSEGAAVVILERLSDAQKNGHRVLALIRSSAVNQDGRSNGPTAPNGPAQQAVIREALQRAHLQPGAVGYVECHGTGTPLGDPIEVHALGAVLARPDTRQLPLLIGSLKSNLGHMEGAAGIGGLIKVALMVERGLVPRSLHFARPNPHIAWHDLALQVASTPVAWPDDASPRVAGVSSFGISGTNAHIIVQQAPPLTLPAPSPAEPSRAPLSAALCVLSARTPQALADAALRLHQHLLDNPRHTLHDVAFSLALRAPLEHRLAFVVSSISELQHALARRASSASAAPDPVAAAMPLGKTLRKVAFVFSGAAHGRALGRELFMEEPVFRAMFLAADRAIARESGQSILAALSPLPDGPPIPDALAGALAFGVQLALATLLRSWGVEPAVVVAEGVGEAAAACFAAVSSLSAAAKTVCQLAGLPAVATESTPESTTESTPASPAGAPLTPEDPSPHAGPAPRVLHAKEWVAERDVAVLELWPGPVLPRSPLAPELGARREAHAGVPLPLRCFEPGQPERLSLLRALGASFERGLTWPLASSFEPGRRLELPTYPWQRQRYWLESSTRERTPASELADLLRQLGERASLSEAAQVGVRELLAALASESPDARPAPVIALDAEVAQLRSLGSQRDVLRWLTERCAALLGHASTGSVDVERGLFDMGLDSLKLTELQRSLQLALGRSLPESTLFTHPNLSALARMIWRELRPGPEPRPGAEPRPAATQRPPRRASEPAAASSDGALALDGALESNVEDLARYINSLD